MKNRKAMFAALVGFYLLMWGGGVVSYVLLGGPPQDARWTAGAFLFVAGAIVAVTSSRKDLRLLVAGALTGFASEFVGVHFGFLFSPYRYTDVLQPQALGVPLPMIAAWLVLLGYVREMLRALGLPVWGRIFLGASWMTAIDLIIDPLAANQLGYWVWEQDGVYYGIPWRNFLGWFVVSAVIFSVMGRQPERNLWARNVGLSIILFFTVIAFAYKLLLAGMVGAVLFLIDLNQTARLRDKREITEQTK
ncbi:MAG: carotenoid biosynthesis protein [Acidobacteria bacterium]|nr:carotenoid biosynthesis protein [Acidobacteriota bacterium]